MLHGCFLFEFSTAASPQSRRKVYNTESMSCTQIAIVSNVQLNLRQCMAMECREIKCMRNQWIPGPFLERAWARLLCIARSGWPDVLHLHYFN